MKLKTNYAVLGSLLLASASATAATVSFTSADYADAGLSTDADGTLVGAVNLVAAIGGTATDTVNTVIFDRVDAAGSDSTIALAGTVMVDIFAGTSNNSAGTTTNYTGALLQNFVFDGPAASGGDLTFSGLTAGYTYELQMVFMDDRDGTPGPDLQGTNIDLWSTATQPGTAAEHSTVDIDTAQLVTGTFTADGTSQSVYVQQNTGLAGSFDGQTAAFQLRITAVPEPSSTALLGLGGLALIMRRRK